MHKRYFPFVMFVFGAALGVLSKFLDIYTSNLGNMFSQLSVWILLGTLISVFSKSKRTAAVNVLLFCVGMLITYYLTAELTSSTYSMTFVYGWCVFTLFSPVFAVFTWQTKEKGVFPKVISTGILLVTLLASVVLFAGPRIYDVVILLLLAYVLLLHKIKR